MSELNKFVEYRGMMLDENIISNLLDIKELEVQDRKFAVPLSFMSCSKSQNVAKQFLEKQKHRTYEEKVRGFCPVLFKIHVTSLDKTFLDLYESYYPDSVVALICAVDIENISKYSEEQKVLLRGAFFQVLRFYESKEKIDGKDSMPKMPLYANMFLGWKDKEVRQNVTVNNKSITLNGKNITVKLTQM